jgi:raffinose/stachyose/melibiose transport system substrate-binding protein
MDAQGGILFFDQMVIGKYIEEMLVGTSTPVQVLENIDADREALMEIAE